MSAAPVASTLLLGGRAVVFPALPGPPGSLFLSHLLRSASEPQPAGLNLLVLYPRSAPLHLLPASVIDHMDRHPVTGTWWL